MARLGRRRGDQAAVREALKKVDAPVSAAPRRAVGKLTIRPSAVAKLSVTPSVVASLSIREIA
jgi:hypothetical protein